MAGLGITSTTPATRWKSYLTGAMPIIFSGGGLPKALFSNDSQTVTLIDADGESVSFVMAAGVPIQVRPAQITSISGASIIALFD